MPARSSSFAALMAILVTATVVTPIQGQNPLDKIKKAIQKKAKPPQIPTQPPAAAGAGAPAAPTAPAGQPLNAKVQETLMGPRVSGGVPSPVFMSEDGNHLGIITAKGSRQVVLLDGVEGPVFDEIPYQQGFTGFGGIHWSPTGGRSVYGARRGGDAIVVVDGKEAGTLETTKTQTGGLAPAGWKFWFNRDGSRLAYPARSETGSWVMVVDGVKSPTYRSIDVLQTMLNGKGLIYVAQTADGQWHAVVDGKPGPGYDEIGELKVTPDGAHYAFIATRRSAGPGGAATVAELAVIDGVESAPERDISDLEQAPDGRVSYMAMRPQTTSGGNPPHLIAGGLDIPWTTTFGPAVAAGPAPQYHVAWSADGKRFACVQQNHPNPGVTVLVNGKPMGPTYRSANQLVWSPDGSRLAYQAVAESGTFLVLDGEESSGYRWIKEFQWSPDGKRYAFSGATSADIVMMVDGKEQPKSMGLSTGSLRFSPDSKHVAFGAQTTVANYQPMVDGVLKPHYLGNFATRVLGNLPIAIPQLFYSPDGNHLAYVGGKTDGTGKIAVWVDGVAQQAPVPSYFHPAWSPDSKHLAAVTGNGSGQGWNIMIDGKFGPVFEDILVLNEASARFVTPHTYRYYTFKGTEIYRVTLELGS